MGLEQAVNNLAKVAVVVAGIYGAVQLTPLILPYYASSSTQLAVAATSGADIGYPVGSATDSKTK